MTDQREEPGTSSWLHDETFQLPDETRDDVARRRRELYDAMQELEVVVSRPGASPDWRTQLRSVLAHLEAALERHVHEVEGEDGLFEDVIRREPRMASSVNSLKEGHVVLQAACRHALDGVQDETVSVDRIRQRVNVVLMRLARHRQKGSEMLYDAYVVDIATGD